MRSSALFSCSSFNSMLFTSKQGIKLECFSRFQNPLSWSSKQQNLDYAHLNIMGNLVLNQIQSRVSISKWSLGVILKPNEAYMLF